MRSIDEDVWNRNNVTYQNTLKVIADDFNKGFITFKEFEKRKKELRNEIFKGRSNPYI